MTIPAISKAAEEYARKGWAVFPIKPGDKRPITERGLLDASTDIQRVRDWWKKHPQANIGISCGPSGIYVVDLDMGEKKNGIAQWQTIKSKYGVSDNTLTSITPSGGRHLIYEMPDHKLRNTSQKIAPGIDTRGDGGYIVVTPSVVAGKNYQWQDPQAPIQKLPTQIIDLLSKEKTDNPLTELLKTSAEIAAKPPRPPDWLTHKFIERGELVILAAPGGHMKSLLMLDWAVCVAAGMKWLEIGNSGFFTHAANVLWLNTDNGENTHEARLSSIMRGRGLTDIPLYSITITDFELANPDHIKNLHLAADEVQADVIVIDTISGALTGVDENSAKEMTLPAAHLRALAGAGRTVIGLHHPPKNDAAGTRGSSVLPNKVDRVYTLSRDEDLLTIKPTKIRNSPSPSSIIALSQLQFDPKTEALLSVRFLDGGGAKQERAQAELQDKIKDALEGSPSGMTKNALRKIVKCRNAELTEALFDMRHAGMISRSEGARGAEIYQLIA